MTKTHKLIPFRDCVQKKLGIRQNDNYETNILSELLICPTGLPFFPDE